MHLVVKCLDQPTKMQHNIYAILCGGDFGFKAMWYSGQFQEARDKTEHREGAFDFEGTAG